MKTEIIIILDRSGSMQTIASDVEGNLVRFVKEQAELPDEGYLTLVRFDDIVERVFTAKPLKEVDMADLVVAPRNMTALFDAIGKTISESKERFEKAAQKPDKVIVAILTDGQENQSREYSRDSIRDIISDMEKKYSWEFVFMGANIDSFAVGGSVG